MLRALLFLAAAFAVVGCEIPQDPDATLDKVSGGTMRVGVTESDPWVELNGAGDPTWGVDVELVRRFARDLGARVEWVDGSEEELVHAMKRGALDLVVGGITKKTRWKKEVALTRPYATVETVVARRPGASGDDKFEGERVEVELGTEAEELAVKKTDAEVVPVSSLEGADGPVAAEEFVIDDLGLAPALELNEEKHVMLVPFGENAWMVRLERFLLNREDEIRDLVTEVGKP